MPTIDTEKIRNAAVYIDGKPIKGIQEIELPEMSIARGKFIDKFKKLIRTEIFLEKWKAAQKEENYWLTVKMFEAYKKAESLREKLMESNSTKQRR